MNGRSKYVIGIVCVLVVLLVGGVVLANINDPKEPSQASTAKTKAPTNNTATTSQSGSGDSKNVSAKAIEIKDYAYSPATITVKVGDTVTWTNQDAMRHDVVMDDSNAEGPASELLAKGETYSYTFTKAGTYAYHCSPHPYMKGTVIVEE